MTSHHIIRKLFLPGLVLLIGGIVSCTDLNELESRMDDLEKIVSVSISKQIESMQLSLKNLESSSYQLSSFINGLDGDVSELKRRGETYGRDIEALKEQLKNLDTDIKSWAQGLFSTLNQYEKISDDIREIKTSLSTLSGLDQTVAQLREEFDSCEAEVKEIKDSLRNVLKDIEAIKEQISKMIESVQSIVVIPYYSDGSVMMTGSTSNEIRFEVLPLSAADSIARVGVTALSLDYVETSTKAGDLLVNIPLRDVYFSDNLLTVIADGSQLKESILSGEQTINARLKVSDGTVARSSEFFSLYFNKNACLTLDAELLSPNSVRLRGFAVSESVDHHDEEIGFEYGVSPELDSPKSIIAGPIDEHGTFFQTLNSLDPETTFYYRAFHRTANRLDYGEIKSFVTTNYEMVDLGLSVMWATCNIGAETESDIGGLFAWGELEEKEDYRMDNYDVPFQSLLSEQYDAATQRMGGKWRMPTNTDFQELIDSCDIQWVDNYNGTGVPGILATRSTPNSTGQSNSIFFPRTYSSAAGEEGCNYWSSSSGSAGDYGFVFWGSSEKIVQTKNAFLGIRESYSGLPIRPVWGERKVDATDLILEDVTLLVGEEKIVYCEVLPENVHSKSISWFIADKEIASVTSITENSCLVSGNKEGVTTLRAIGPSSTYKSVNITVKERSYSEPPLVDMGLSVKWATYNLGASSPEERGVLCLWGDDEVEDYDGKMYKWWMPQYYRNSYWDKELDGISLLGYNPDSSLGEVDNQGVLKPEDDIASIILGDDWHIPTRAEWDELLNNSTIWWINDYRQTGISGTLFVSNVPGYTDNQVFIPCHTNPIQPLITYYYWSSTVSPFIYSSYAYANNYSTGVSTGLGTKTVLDASLILCSRGSLGAIRPVFGKRKQQASKMELSHSSISVREWEEIPIAGIFLPENPQSEEIRWTIEDENVAFLDYGGIVDNLNRLHSASAGHTTIVATSVDGGFKSTCDVVVTPAEYNTDFVDLGLGVKWATCNLGAISPDEPGMFFRWGETVPIKASDNDYDNYPWCSLDVDHFIATKYARYNEILEPEDDVAHVCLGGKWRMPTYSEMSQLARQCSWSMIDNYENTGVQGYLVTGKNGNSIFIPLAGYYLSYFSFKNKETALWTSSSFGGLNAMAIHCTTSSNGPRAEHNLKLWCYSIRPVYDE